MRGALSVLRPRARTAAAARDSRGPARKQRDARRPARKQEDTGLDLPDGPVTLEHPAQLLKRIEFEVMRRLDGFLFGDYTGLFYGPSLDLAEVREYQAGDEVRRIDWNVTARTGTLHVRQYREERQVRSCLVVDATPSMHLGSRRRSKLQMALEFAALAAAVQVRRGNEVGALTFSGEALVPTPMGSSRRQPLAIVDSLLQAAGGTPDSTGDPGAGPGTLGDALSRAGATLRRRTLLFVVSDFISPADRAWRDELRRLAAKHDVIAVQVSDPLEHALPSAGDLRFRDAESGEELWFDSGDAVLREEYARLAVERQQSLEHSLREAGVDLLQLSTAQELVQPLIHFTLARRGRRRLAR